MSFDVDTDVIVLGAGSVGCFTALCLRERGIAVTVLDQGRPGQQSSGVNMGSLRLQGRYLGQLPLALRSQELWEQAEERLGARLDYHRGGLLYVATSDDELQRLEKMARTEAELGLQTDIMDGAAMHARWPWMAHWEHGGSWSPQSATVNSRLVTPALARKAEALGAEFVIGPEIVALEPMDEGVILTARDGRRFRCRRLVNAAGFWAGRVAEMLGEPVPIFAAGPVQVVSEPVPHFLDAMIYTSDSKVIFRQTRRGNMLVAGHPRIPVDAVARRSRVPAGKTLRNFRRMLRLAPHLEGTTILRSWTGIEGYLPDMLPVLGESRRHSGVIHAFGFSGHGLQIATGVGEVVADLLSEGGTQMPIADFAVDRFSGKLRDDVDLRHEFEDDVKHA